MRNDNVPVTVGDVSEWADETLAEWMPGYTYDFEKQTQYKVVHVGPQLYKVHPEDPADHREARVFKVSVIVSEQR